MAARPALTVVVPARDAATYLPAALTSLTRQQVSTEARDLEVLVVDDGSRDGTGRVAESFCATLPGLRVLRHPTPYGLSASRNHALAESHGEHLVFLDADDWLLPGTLGAALATRSRLDVDFVVVDQLQVTGHERTPRRAPETRREVRLDPRAGIERTDRTTMVNYPNVVTRICHRRLLDAGLLSFDESLRTAEDRPWTWRLHLDAHSYAVCARGTYAYRREVPGSLTSVLDARRLDVLTAYRRILALVATRAHDERDAEALTAKAVRDLLVVLVHHAGHAHELPRQVLDALRDGAAALLAEVDHGLLDRQLAALGASRRDQLTVLGVGAGVRAA